MLAFETNFWVHAGSLGESKQLVSFSMKQLIRVATFRAAWAGWSQGLGGARIFVTMLPKFDGNLPGLVNSKCSTRKKLIGEYNKKCDSQIDFEKIECNIC